MLTVTDAASQHLAAILAQESVPDEAAIRLVHEGQSLGMQADTARPDDVTFEHDGRTILLLDPQVAELLTDETLDLENESLTLQQSGDA
jgi:Fe-S cluster assembly iron-binding protein IscA